MHGAEDGGNAPEPPHWIAAAGCAGLAMTGNERGGKVGAGGNGRRCRHRERSEAIQIGGCGHHRGRWIATAPAGASRHAQLITIVNAQMRDAIGQQAARRN